MDRMLLAELAILVHFQTIRVVLLVLVRAVVAAMALRALERDIVAHVSTPCICFSKCHQHNLTHLARCVNDDFECTHK
jgi:hypothetical protein